MTNISPRWIWKIHMMNMYNDHVKVRMIIVRKQRIPQIHLVPMVAMCLNPEKGPEWYDDFLNTITDGLSLLTDNLPPFIRIAIAIAIAIDSGEKENLQRLMIKTKLKWYCIVVCCGGCTSKYH